MEQEIKKEKSENKEIVSCQTWYMSLTRHISNWCDSKRKICPDPTQDYLALLLKHTPSSCSPLLPTRNQRAPPDRSQPVLLLWITVSQEQEFTFPSVETHISLHPNLISL